MPDFNIKNTHVDQDGNVTVESKSNVRMSAFAGRVFLYAFIGLLISAVSCVLASWLLKSSQTSSQFTTAYGIMLAISAPGVLIISIIMAIKMRHLDKPMGVGIWVMFSIYAVCFGLMLTPFAIILDFYTFGTALGATALCFGSMALIGMLSKKDMSVYGLVGMGLLSGVLIIGLVFVLFRFAFSTSVNWWINVIVTGVAIIALMFISLFDVNKIKQMGQMGADGKSNLAMMCALSIYTDIMALLIRLLYLFVLLAAKKN